MGLLALALLAAPKAAAADLALNVGAIEVVGLPPAHLGFYPYLGFSASFVPSSHATLIIALSYEYSFDQQRGGLVGVFTSDFPLNDRLGVDLNVIFIQDQPGLHFEQSLFFLGAGPGLTVYLGKWALSPYVSLFYGLNAPGFSVVPGVNLSFTL